MASLPTAYFVALRPPFPIRQAQCVQAFLLISAAFCKVFTSYAFLSSVLPSVLHSVAYLAETILSLLLINYRAKMGLNSHTLLPGNSTADKLVRQGTLLQPFSVLCSLSFLLLVSTLFSDWKRRVSSKFFHKQVPLYPLRNLCFLVTLLVFSPVFAATGTAFC